MFQIGDSYYSYGSNKIPGVPHDNIEAVKWYRKAADLGNLDAVHALLGYYDGDTFRHRDTVESAKWCRKAADLGDRRAMHRVAELYSIGNGVPVNYTEAANWYRKAADLGDSDAMRLLGGCYAEGKGVGKDDVQAYMWCSLRAVEVSGWDEALWNERYNLEQRMTPVQVAEAQRLATEYFAKTRKETGPTH